MSALLKKILFIATLFIAFGFFLTQGNFFQNSNITQTQNVSPSVSLPQQNQESQQLPCTGNPTPSQTEGPFYKTGSPKRNNIAQAQSDAAEAVPGEKLIVTGTVFDKNCKSIANAWLDFWQADSNGAYDNTGYKLRGHQYTDENGGYLLETIIPGEYPGRTPHIHVKVHPPSGQILTSQMYFPNATKNQTDSIFNSVLLMNITEGTNGKIAEFNFVLNQ